MYKLYAVWTAPRPGEEDAFERHYTEVHAPLAASIPGVRKVILTRTSDTLGDGESTLHRITELWFDDRAAMEAAEASPEGQATIKDAVEIQERFGAALTSVAGLADEQPLG
ncbi:MAG TPA: EthD family reductase [Solirubrobacterales bacterium]|nr:EthD family reductase [Solirubrobacterales bacterium]